MRASGHMPTSDHEGSDWNCWTCGFKISPMAVSSAVTVSCDLLRTSTLHSMSSRSETVDLVIEEMAQQHGPMLLRSSPELKTTVVIIYSEFCNRWSIFA